MANKRIVDFSADATPATGDLIETVDISDTTDDPTGSSKKVTFANLQTLIGGDTLPVMLEIDDGFFHRFPPIGESFRHRHIRECKVG